MRMFGTSEISDLDRPYPAAHVQHLIRMDRHAPPLRSDSLGRFAVVVPEETK